MEFGGKIIFDGKRGISWIKKDEETGLIVMVFENDEGTETALSFNEELFKTILELGDNIIETGKTEHPIRQGTCQIIPEVVLSLEEEDVSLRTEWQIPSDEENNPVLIIKGKRSGKVELCFNMPQARAIASCCQEIVKARETLLSLQKTKVISAIEGL